MIYFTTPSRTSHVTLLCWLVSFSSQILTTVLQCVKEFLSITLDSNIMLAILLLLKYDNPHILSPLFSCIRFRLGHGIVKSFLNLRFPWDILTILLSFYFLLSIINAYSNPNGITSDVLHKDMISNLSCKHYLHIYFAANFHLTNKIKHMGKDQKFSGSQSSPINQMFY